jgi:cell wall-associated NlpC family hydrolase
MLLVRAWIEAGVFHEFDPRPYSPVWFLHRSDEKYLAWLDAIGTRTETPKPGDVITYQFGRCISHSAILVDDRMVVHAYAPHRMCITTEREAEFLKHRERFSFDMWARLRSTK